MKFKRYLHNPPHLFIDHAVYFLTGATYNKEHLFDDDERKDIFLKAMHKWFQQFEWQINEWVVFSNHYHIVASANKAIDMPVIIQRIHGATATELNQLDSAPGRQVWWNYWDTCLSGGGDYENHLAYLYWNAVKHNVVERPEQYRWSSFNRRKTGAATEAVPDQKVGLSFEIRHIDTF